MDKGCGKIIPIDFRITYVTRPCGSSLFPMRLKRVFCKECLKKQSKSKVGSKNG